MTGTPSSRTCNECRRQRKKCDEKQPTCSRCQRIGVKCVGSGVRRFVFKSENLKVVNRQRALARHGPRRQPSNDQSRLFSDLVSILNTESVRFGLFCFGTVFYDLPQLLGSNPTLDTSLAALCASFHMMHNNQPSSRAKALQLYGATVGSLRKSLEIPVTGRVNVAQTVCAVYIITICQRVVGYKNAPRLKHGDALSCLLRAVAIDSMPDRFEGGTLAAFYTTVVAEAFFNPEADLGPDFWHTFESVERLGIPPNPFTIINARPIAEIACFIREPVPNLSQIRSYYEISLAEMPQLRQVVAKTLAAAAEPNSPAMAQWEISRWQGGYFRALGLTCILNRVLRSFDTDPKLIVESYGICDEIIQAAKVSLGHRPFGGLHATLALVPACGAAGESHQAAELEDLLVVFQGDFAGENFMGAAQLAREGFENMDKISNAISKASASVDRTEEVDWVLDEVSYGMNAKSGCIVI